MNRANGFDRFAGSAILVASCALAAPAFAADPGAASAYSQWAGFYAGVVYGAGVSTANSSQTASRSVTGWGQTSGALVGYDFQTGRYVYGAEGELSFHLLRPDDTGVQPNLPVPPLAAHVVDTPVTERLRLRLGYDSGAFLPYVAVGVASARIYEAGDAWPAVQYGQTRQATGLSLGAGLEWRFAAPILGPLVVRGEYVLDAYPGQSYAVFPKPAQPIRTSAVEQFFRVGVIDYIDPAWRPTADSGTFDWSGAYGGFLAGAMWAEPHTSLGGATTNNSAAGPVAGVFTGRNFLFGPWMLGWEGAVEVTNVTGTGPQPTGAPMDAVSYRNYFEADARLRAGYAVGRFLPYVTAGLDWGRSEQTDLVSGSYRGRIWSDNATAGAGVEYAFDDRWTARLEYLYDWSYDSNSTELDHLALEQTRPAQTLRAGLAYYFH
ncbi:MAG: outer membrane beta-barrel protein [Roseiarcus sp.]